MVKKPDPRKTEKKRPTGRTVPRRAPKPDEPLPQRLGTRAVVLGARISELREEIKQSTSDEERQGFAAEIEHLQAQQTDLRLRAAYRHALPPGPIKRELVDELIEADLRSLSGEESGQELRVPEEQGMSDDKLTELSDKIDALSNLMEARFNAVPTYPVIGGICAGFVAMLITGYLLLAGDIDKQDTRISALEREVGIISTKIDGMQGDISELKATSAKINSDIAEIKVGLARLAARPNPDQ